MPPRISGSMRRAEAGLCRSEKVSPWKENPQWSPTVVWRYAPQLQERNKLHHTTESHKMGNNSSWSGRTIFFTRLSVNSLKLHSKEERTRLNFSKRDKLTRHCCKGVMFTIREQVPLDRYLREIIIFKIQTEWNSHLNNHYFPVKCTSSYRRGDTVLSCSPLQSSS